MNAPLQGLLDLCFPPKCSLCGKLGTDALCDACIESFSRLLPPLCDRCGYPCVPGIACTHCPDGTGSLSFARAFGIYDGSLREAIHVLKYGGRARLGEPLGRLLADYARQDPALSEAPWDAIIPVPIHPARQRQRGFNQSELLAAPVAEALGAPLEARWLIRIRRTSPQARLTRDRRLTNLRGAFRLREDAEVSGKNILILDDVLTTMSTVKEAARMLQEAGSRTIGALALAIDL